MNVTGNVVKYDPQEGYTQYTLEIEEYLVGRKQEIRIDSDRLHEPIRIFEEDNLVKISYFELDGELVTHALYCVDDSCPDHPHPEVSK